VHFQPLNLLRNLTVSYQERWDDDQGPQIRWHSITEREPRQHPWPEQFRNLTIHYCDRQIQGRDESEKPE
jgi:hypothetical protein